MIRCFLAALLGALAVAAPASAGTVESAGGTVTYKGTSGLDWPNASTSAGILRISDSNGLTSTSCTAVDESTVECPMPTRYRAELGAGNDNHGFGSSDAALPSGVAIELIGEGGNDTLEPWDPADGAPQGGSRLVEGGEGDDKIYGSLGADNLDGGPGQDTVYGYGGADQVKGSDGNDTLSGDTGHGALVPVSSFVGDVVDGGAGTDKFTDYDNTSPLLVTVTVDGQPGDGRSGENDNLISVETIDALAAGSWTLSEAADTIYVFGGDGTTTVKGLGGDDRLEGDKDVEDLDGGAGNDHVEGGYNNDTLTGGPGQDRIYGDDADSQCGGGGQSCTIPFGNDTIFARDGEADSIDCGVGADRAVVDAIDTVAGNCETVEKPATPPGPIAGPGVKTCKVPKVAKLKQAAAVKKVKAAGCKTRVKKVKSRTVKKGRVIRTSPKAGKVVKAGTTVTVYVSRGRR